MAKPAGKKPRLLNPLVSNGVLAATNDVVTNRYRRNLAVITSASLGLSISTGGVYMLTGEPHPRLVVPGALISAVLLNRIANGVSNDSIHRATLLLGKALGEEAQKNQPLVEFLKPWKYVFVDSTGMIAGTNRPRIAGIGRLRLETKKILEGKY
ncbi:MAG TPA: hypothetical protein VJH23_02005 [archaeon]|nr:hypothetical protein [archaeon]